MMTTPLGDCAACIKKTVSACKFAFVATQRTLTRTCFLLAYLLVSQISIATIEFHIPGEVGAVLPAKYSGTNCLASGQAYIVQPSSDYLTQVKLFLKDSTGGETVVSQWDYSAIPSPAPLFYALVLKVRFASTHFADGSNVTIYMKAKDNHGVEYTSPDSNVPVYNKGMVYEHGAFAGSNTGGVAAQVALENMKHTVSNVEMNGQWTKNTFLSDLAIPTALHVGTHGGPGYVLDSPGASITSSDVYNSRNAAMLNGVPPMNVAFVDACETAQSSSFLEELLHPLPPLVKDSAAVGFTIVVNSAWSPDYGSAFWEALTDKKTVGQAREALVKKYNELLDLNDTTFERLDTTNTVIVGDPKTRLNGVWTGNQNLPPGVWFMEI